MASDRRSNMKFAPLRYAVVWLGYAWMRAIAHLPFAWQLALGRGLGRLMRLVVPSRRRVVARNLEACFPELSAAERERLLADHFEALGASLIEMGMGWFGSPETVRSLVRDPRKIESRPHLHAKAFDFTDPQATRRFFRSKLPHSRRVVSETGASDHSHRLCEAET